MKCDVVREELVAVAEACATQQTRDAIDAHIRECPACRGEMEQLEILKQRLVSAGRGTRPFDLEERVMRRIQSESPPELRSCARESRWSNLWSALITSGRVRMAIACCAAVGVLVAAAVLFYPSSHAWSIERSIEAAREYKGIYMAGVIDGRQECELWIRARADHSQMRNMRLRVGQLIVWVKGNKTFFYEPGSRIVYTDDAQTVGFSPWPGPKLFEMIRTVGLSRVTYELNLKTGHEKAVAEASFTDMDGPKSWVMEFDTSTNLLLSIRQWHNLLRAGTTSFESRKIQFYEDLPDDIFAVELPANVTFQPKEISVATEVLGLLTLPQYGISTIGLSEEEASRRIVGEMWVALIHSDWTRFRQLCPTAAGWTDDALKVLVGGVDGQDAVVEVLEVGSVIRRGQSRIGPVVVVPSRVRHRDGNIYEQKMIIQFRPSEIAPSCVVYGPYGAAYRIE